jgi:hypothetical protein
MSRNNKNAREHATAAKFTELRKKGESGPASTKPQHGKKAAWWQKFPSYGAWLRHGKSAKPAEM